VIAMTRKTLLVLSGIVLLAATGCGSIREKYDTVRAFAKDIKPGHSYQTFSSRSGSMLPTIGTTDLLLVDKSAYDAAQPQRGDIIVFMPPVESKNPFLKRVLAVPGDRVWVRKGRIEVNGRGLPASAPPMHPNYDVAIASYRIVVDGFPLDPLVADIVPRSRWTAPDRLPPGCYFVVGDNVNNSEDSHVYGCAELRGNFSSGARRGEPTELVGKVVKILAGLPPNP
jgi:signal peptidase I